MLTRNSAVLTLRNGSVKSVSGVFGGGKEQEIINETPLDAERTGVYSGFFESPDGGLYVLGAQLTLDNQDFTVTSVSILRRLAGDYHYALRYVRGWQ